MTTLREAALQALEALELAKLNGKAGMYPAEIEEIAAAITALRAALAEPVQEPVAWMDVDDRGNMLSLRFWSEGGREEVPLYTAPQRQPLTEDETMILLNETAGHYWADEAHIQRFRAAIEKAHGIGGKE